MKRAASLATMVTLLRHLASASERGLPLAEVSRILAEDPDLAAADRELLRAMTTALEQGAALPDAMAALPDAFAAETVDLLRQAQAGDATLRTLRALADDFERRRAGRSRVRLALAWPLSLAMMLALLFALMAVFVMPGFVDLYDSFRIGLPAPTRVVFGLGAWVWLWPGLLAACIALAAGYSAGVLPERLATAIEAVIGRLGFVRRLQVARFTSRLLGLAIASRGDRGLLAAALSHLAATTPEPLRGVGRRLRDAVATAMPLSDSLLREPSLPRRVALHARLGERFDDLAAALAQLEVEADEDERLALARFERATILLLYAAVGIAIGFVVLAVYLPIFSLGMLA